MYSTDVTRAPFRAAAASEAESRLAPLFCRRMLDAAEPAFDDRLGAIGAASGDSEGASESGSGIGGERERHETREERVGDSMHTVATRKSGTVSDSCVAQGLPVLVSLRDSGY